MIAQLDLFAVLERPSAPAPAPLIARPSATPATASVTVHFSDERTATVLEEQPEPPRYREHLERIAVDPKRLDKGGDIDRSYSADVICYDSKLRSTFRLNGGDWVNTGGMWWAGGRYCDCYRVVSRAAFDGPTSTYQTNDWSMKRDSDLGGYHGMLVKHGGREVVLVGPPIVIVAGQPEQSTLI